MRQTSGKDSLIGQGGQIALEYVLLLMIGVSMAMIITSAVASRNENSPGFLVKKWYEIIKVIGEDPADDLKPAAT